MNHLVCVALALLAGVLACLPGTAHAAGQVAATHLELTGHWVGFAAIALFLIAYGLVMAEEFTHLRKSKPVILAAGIIWGLIGAVYAGNGLDHLAEEAVRHNLLEYAELMLFLLVAMTYINAMEERRVFEALRTWLIARGFGYRQLFWINSSDFNIKRFGGYAFDGISENRWGSSGQARI